MSRFADLKKIVCLSAALLCVCPFCFACADKPPEPLPYDAKLFDKAERWAQEEFLSENRTNYPSKDDNLPPERCFIINSDDEFDRAFASFPEEVTFSRDILAVYFFTDIYYGFACQLQAVTASNGAITIDVLHEMAEQKPDGARPPATSMPLQRCLVIRLTDCEYESVQVIMNYP